jgi:hypothetical protein
MVIAAAVVLVGIVATGGTALALTGHPLLNSPPAVTAALPTVTPTQTPTPIPTTPAPPPPPAPTPSEAPAQEPAPVVAEESQQPQDPQDWESPPVRVPASCDDLFTQQDVEDILGEVVEPSDPDPFWNAGSYSDERIGSLGCGWTSDSTLQNALPGGFSVKVVPGVEAADYEETMQELNWGGSDTIAELGPDAHSWCERSREPSSCQLVDLVNGYGVTLYASPQDKAGMTDERRDAAKALFTSIVGQLAELGAPDPLWEPSGADITGASSCDGLIGPDDFSSLFEGSEVREFKAEGGEYAMASFYTNRQVGTYWCSWTVDDEPGPLVAVVPGGAAYFEDARGDTRYDWEPTSDYPGEAYITDDGLMVSILIDNAWVEVRSPTVDLLPSLVDTVLDNVGA